MLVEVLLFASLKDDLGGTLRLDVPEERPGEATVGALRAAFVAAHPGAARLGKRILVAVNETYVGEGDVVRPGDAVAFLPPVAGG